MSSHSNRARTDSISRSSRQDSRSPNTYDKLQEGGSPSHPRRSTRPSKIPAMSPKKTDNHASREDEEELVGLDTPLGSVKNCSLLIKATRNKNLALVRALLKMGDSVYFRNIDGWTALHMAAVYGAVDVAVVLLDAGADIEAKCKSGRTPLFLACREKQLAMAKMLVERGADTSTADSSDWTMLFQAASAGSLEIVKWLFKKLDCNTYERVISKQPEKLLRELAGKGCKKVEKYLKDSCNTRINPDGDKAGRPANLKVRTTPRVVSPGPDVYDTTTDPPGLVLLLNYITFSGSDIQDRQGAEYDTMNIESVFKQMGYEVEAYEDLTWKDTMSRIKEFSTSERLKKAGCAVVVVSSHGGTDPSSFLTSDGEEVSVSHLHQSFIKDQSKEVKQMAKIFFFQFCRGKIRPILEIDSMDYTPKNIISFYSTSYGFVSYRNPESGSLFLSVVCEVLAQRAWQDDHVVLFREVQNRYQEKGMGTTPEIQNLGFSKTFYFNPRPSKRSRNHSQEIKAFSVTVQVGINGRKQSQSIGNNLKQKSQMYESLCFRLQQPNQLQEMRPQRKYIWNKTE